VTLSGCGIDRSGLGQDATGSGGTGAAGSGGGGIGGGGGAAGGHGGAGGASGTDGGAVCNVACTVGRMCCNGGCVNPQNDPMNCGGCGNHCEGNTPLCSAGNCVQPPCSPMAELCAPGSVCCGSACCAPGQLCCESNGPVSGGPPSCFAPTAQQSTCPQGCAPLCVSDRNQKKNIAPVDPAAILAKVGRLPISTWTYRRESDQVRHLGPMAQDFRASFGLGDDDRTYYAVDAQGVALAAIQALDGLVASQQRRIQELERQNQSLGRRLRAVETRRNR
jgi:hypothetical protein